MIKKSLEQDMNNSWSNCEQVVSMLSTSKILMFSKSQEFIEYAWKSHEQVMNSSCTSNEQVKKK